MLGLLKNIETSVNPQESGARSGLKLFTVGWMVSMVETIRNLRVVDNRGNLRRPNRFNFIILCVIYMCLAWVEGTRNACDILWCEWVRCAVLFLWMAHQTIMTRHSANSADLTLPLVLCPWRFEIKMSKAYHRDHRVEENWQSLKFCSPLWLKAKSKETLLYVEVISVIKWINDCLAVATVWLWTCLSRDLPFDSVV